MSSENKTILKFSKFHMRLNKTIVNLGNVFRIAVFRDEGAQLHIKRKEVNEDFED